MSGETRVEFHRQLQRLDISIGSLFGLVPDAIGSAVGALVSADDDISTGLDHWRGLVGELYEDVDRTIEVLVARQQPVAGDLRFLLACVRIVPMLRESIDLVGDLAAQSHQGIGRFLTPRLTALVQRLGDQSRQLWSDLDDSWRLRDQNRLSTVRKQLDGISETRSVLSSELASGAVDLPVAIEMAVVGRIFDRLARKGYDTARCLDPVVSRGPGDVLA